MSKYEEQQNKQIGNFSLQYTYINIQDLESPEFKVKETTQYMLDNTEDEFQKTVLKQLDLTSQKTDWLIRSLGIINNELKQINANLNVTNSKVKSHDRKLESLEEWKVGVDENLKDGNETLNWVNQERQRSAWKKNLITAAWALFVSVATIAAAWWGILKPSEQNLNKDLVHQVVKETIQTISNN